ncbi:hypothetical protein [Clostridium sp. YIM B02506]|uniref:YczE/YyaS/YitT family protein n=1 Tax=Clostridium sp. YIM B02506 TaxID=2910680 RepID=UPI001EEF3BC0|nr:hypothetical protein [Clostridium sp. YIM B02506]
MKIKRIILCFLMIILVSFGASLTLKAAVGVGAWDALALTGSSITGIQVGTVGMILNFLCIFIELVILRKDFKLKHALQIVLCFIIGYTVNFFFYDVLGGINLSNYFVRVAVLIIGYVINAFTVAVIMLLDVVTFALEGACKAISDKTKILFHNFRQGVDVAFIVITIIMAFVFNVPLSVREGTVIGMIIFGPIMGVFMKLLKPIFQKYDLTDYN